MFKGYIIKYFQDLIILSFTFLLLNSLRYVKKILSLKTIQYDLYYKIYIQKKKKKS